MFQSTLINRLATTAMLFNSGKVVSWGRGYGFINDNADGKQYFVHQSAIQVENDGFRALTVGQEVEYEVTTGQNGKPCATNVTGPGGVKLPSGSRPAGQGRGFGGRGRGGDNGGRGGFNRNDNNYQNDNRQRGNNNFGDEF
ncbi:mitochondrial RNA-binding protein [Angomonas deanei]|uniref:'Cold-shock' DNA-binding domain containing protein, putative n=1 Tax=Angomonas deanei TaxID=59799 RepID=A0A7G2CJ64_9TRYP|nr:mitochondrial RNA-binding protein [Angomonas deanei]CAD2218302.1 'Cold-shock' DNA-binding domain containing protein, putative [Angomonas deanei]|eukprot:EPY32532.1 mitochondrial RNA-binding protein [Angomonas deanei]